MTKLKQGHGEPTCNVLDFLVDKALATRGFQWQPPLHEVRPVGKLTTQPSSEAAYVPISLYRSLPCSLYCSYISL